MRMFIALAVFFVVAAATWTLRGQEAGKPKTAVIQWVADGPPLVYDIRYAGGDSTTMPTALKYLLKDLAESEGYYLTGEDKSKTLATQAKRISLEYTAARSKPRNVRTGKIEIKEQPGAVVCVVSFNRKPAPEHLGRTGELLEIFGKKYLKAPKSARSTVESHQTAKASVWSFEVRFAAPAAKDKK